MWEPAIIALILVASWYIHPIVTLFYILLVVLFRKDDIIYLFDKIIDKVLRWR